MFVCKICNKEFKTPSELGRHIGAKHKDISVQEYYKKYINTSQDDICPICKNKKLKFISISRGFSNTCKECSKLKGDINYYKLIYGEEKGAEKWKLYKNKMKGMHTKKWYIEKYGESKGTKKYKEKCQKSAVNLKNLQNKYGKEEGKQKWVEINNKKKFSNSKEGLISKYGEEKANKICEKFAISLENFQHKYGEIIGEEKWNDFIKKQKLSSKRCIDYWLNKGYNEKTAKKMVSNHQKTFSLDKCIEKYGEEDGYRRWKERQEKWQNTLNNKTDEEKRKINKKKFPGYQKNYFMSKAEKELKHALNCKSQLYINGFWYDLYKGNKIIEYNGNYWHCNPIIYNGDYYNEKIKMYANEKWRFDKIKNEVAIRNGYKILTIWESEYKKSPKEVIEKCKEFLHG